MTERQVQLLKGSVDLSISTLGGQLTSLKTIEERESAKNTLLEFLELSEELSKMKPKEDKPKK